MNQFKNALAIISLLFLLLAISCKKDAGSDNTPTPPVISADADTLSDEELAYLDALPRAKGFTAETVILPNGETVASYLQDVDSAFYKSWFEPAGNQSPYDMLGPQDARNALIAKLNLVALNLTNRALHNYEKEGEDKPEQKGIAYSWDSKQYDVRDQKPHCSYYLHGLDCSGFLYQLFLNAGVPFPKGRAEDQRQPSVIQSAIQAALPTLKKVKVDDLKQLPVDKFQSGDIIYWIRPTDKTPMAFHLGIVLKKADGMIAIFASNGNGKSCDDNLLPTHGPTTFQIEQAPTFFGKVNYGIVRINANISGKYDLILRCQNYNTDAITLHLDFPADTKNKFQVIGNGTDYDGLALTCVADLEYDNTTNVLSGHFLFKKPAQPDFYRNDTFTVELKKDNTDYFNLTLGDNNLAECSLEGRLKNQE